MKSLKVAALFSLFLAGCVLDPVDPDDPFGRTTAQIEAERAACVAAGGTFRPAGLLAALTCIKPTADAGKTCIRESDCEGFCLADTTPAVCAPVTPTFGCFLMLDAAGEKIELCAD